VPDYGLLVTPPAQRALDRLPERVAAAIAELLTGDFLAGAVPTGCSMRSTRRGGASLFSGSTIVPTSTGRDNHRVGGAVDSSVPECDAVKRMAGIDPGS
jgi:hypothetical protein